MGRIREPLGYGPCFDCCRSCSPWFSAASANLGKPYEMVFRTRSWRCGPNRAWSRNGPDSFISPDRDGSFFAFDGVDLERCGA